MRLCKFVCFGYLPDLPEGHERVRVERLTSRYLVLGDESLRYEEYDLDNEGDDGKGEGDGGKRRRVFNRSHHWKRNNCG